MVPIGSCQVRLCLAKKDYIRAQILARKISPRAFQKQQGDSTGEIGIEGTAIEEADKVGGSAADTHGSVVAWCLLAHWLHCSRSRRKGLLCCCRATGTTALQLCHRVVRTIYSSSV